MMPFNEWWWSECEILSESSLSDKILCSLHHGLVRDHIPIQMLFYPPKNNLRTIRGQFAIIHVSEAKTIAYRLSHIATDRFLDAIDNVADVIV